MKQLSFPDRFRNEHGAVDLGSVMTGIIVTGVLGAIAVVAIFGFVNINDSDLTKAELKVIRQALVSYHTANDKYPTSSNLTANTQIQSNDVMTELINNDYLPKQYINFAPTLYNGDARFCYVSLDAVVDGNPVKYPQRYEVTFKSPMGKFYNMTDSENVIKNGKSPNCSYLT